MGGEVCTPDRYLLNNGGDRKGEDKGTVDYEYSR